MVTMTTCSAGSWVVAVSNFVTYPVLDGVIPKDPHEAEGWLITGSKFAVYEDHAWIPPLEDFVRQACGKGVPIVGICFGHQILAQALGGKVERFSGGWHVGPESYRLKGLAEDACIMAWHRDQVIEKPEMAEVVGSSPSCRYAALAYGDRAITFQPHPEFTADYLAELIQVRRDILPPRLAEAALVALDRRLDSPGIANRIEAFFKKARG